MVMAILFFGWTPIAIAGKKGAHQKMLSKHTAPSCYAAPDAFLSKTSRQDNWFLEREKKREEKQQLALDKMIAEQLNQRKTKALHGALFRRVAYPARTFRQITHEARKEERLSALAKLTDEEREKLKKDSEKQLEKERIAYEAQLVRERRSNERIRLMEEEQRFYMLLRADYNREKMLAGLVEGESGRARVEAKFVQSVERIRALEKRDEEMMLPRLWDLANIPSDVDGKKCVRNILDAMFPGAENYFKVTEEIVSK